MDPEQTDANTAADSSPTAEAPNTDVTTETPSTSKGAPPKTLDDVANAFIAADTSEESPTEDGDKAPVEKAEKDDAEAPVDDGDAKEEETVDDENKDAEDAEKATDAAPDDPTKPPPFHEHPRWKEVVAERDRLKPLAEAHEKLQAFCQQHDIPAQEVDVMFEIAGLMRTDPRKAYSLMVPIVESMEQHLGIKLPADLEAEVASGKKTPDQAAEVAKLRAEAKQSKAALEQATKRTQQSVVQQMTRSVQDWIGNKQKTDLAFKPKVNGSPDGLYELVDAFYSQAVTAKPPTTPGEAVAYAEQAYDRAKKAFGARTVTATTAKKVLSSTRSSTTPTAKPKTLDEVAMRFAGTTWATKQQR